MLGLAGPPVLAEQRHELPHGVPGLRGCQHVVDDPAARRQPRLRLAHRVERVAGIAHGVGRRDTGPRPRRDEGGVEPELRTEIPVSETMAAVSTTSARGDQSDPSYDALGWAV